MSDLNPICEVALLLQKYLRKGKATSIPDLDLLAAAIRDGALKGPSWFWSAAEKTFTVYCKYATRNYRGFAKEARKWLSMLWLEGVQS